MDDEAQRLGQDAKRVREFYRRMAEATDEERREILEDIDRRQSLHEPGSMLRLERVGCMLMPRIVGPDDDGT